MYQVRVKKPMDVGHFLIGDFEEESIPHRHEYEVEWRCVTESLDEHGFSVDISLMKEMLCQVASEIEGRMLNDLPFFGDRQTSVENFARFVHARLVAMASVHHGIDSAVAESSVIRVWEDDGAWASYAPSTED